MCSESWGIFTEQTTNHPTNNWGHTVTTTTSILATLPPLRQAIPNDIVKSLTGSSCEWTAVTALGRNMGPAQLRIGQAVEKAARLGLIVTKIQRGTTFVQLASLYTLTFETEEGLQRRETQPARVIEAMGRIVSRLADRGEAWDIQVLDAAGDDVTSDFACFQD